MIDPEECPETYPPGGNPNGTPRILLAEDDLSSRILLQAFLSRHGECHVAANGREAVEAFRAGTESGHGYDLVCMDLLMPEMDGRQAVREIRAIEEAQLVRSTDGAKIVMTTTVDAIKEVSRCYEELCDAYLTKPLDLGELQAQMRAWELVV
jgi:two-component system chemotaxis response regulator CheY